MFSLNNILGMLSVAATAATLGFFIYLNSFYERPTPSNESELEALKNDTAKVVVTETFQVKKLVINLFFR